MFKLKCEEPGCGKTFSHDTQGKATQALSLHTRRMHGSMKGDMSARATQPGKRTYKKKQVTQSITVNFCPQCGTDLHRLAVAMALSARMKAK